MRLNIIRNKTIVTRNLTSLWKSGSPIRAPPRRLLNRFHRLETIQKSESMPTSPEKKPAAPEKKSADSPSSRPSSKGSTGPHHDSDSDRPKTASGATSNSSGGSDKKFDSGAAYRPKTEVKGWSHTNEELMLWAQREAQKLQRLAKKHCHKDMQIHKGLGYISKKGSGSPKVMVYWGQVPNESTGTSFCLREHTAPMMHPGLTLQVYKEGYRPGEGDHDPAFVTPLSPDKDQADWWDEDTDDEWSFRKTGNMNTIADGLWFQASMKLWHGNVRSSVAILVGEGWRRARLFHPVFSVPRIRYSGFIC